MRIGFLFNHDGAHQVAHSAPIAFELARRYPAVEVTVMTSNGEELDTVRSIGESHGGAGCDYIELKMPPIYRIGAWAANAFLPYQRLAILKGNLDVFRRFDALVVPEKTSLLLKTRFGLAGLKLIHTRHGAGDRAIGFDAASGAFDFVLVPGRKVLDRLRERGLLKDGRYAVVGYPKFDTAGCRKEGRRRLFANDRPSVLYNPHCDPRLSSWYEMGRAVLDFFYHRQDYNLIFAPHVMLFKRRLHISLGELRARFRAALPKKYARCPHIHIDTGSAACCDMTYTQAADIYLGDVSSQVYEFLLDPRLCIFLNAHGALWRDDPDYLHWRLGPVLDDVTGLGACLSRAAAAQVHFRPLQEELFRYTFDLRPTRSSVRAADAIAAYLKVGNSDRFDEPQDVQGDAPVAVAAVL